MFYKNLIINRLYLLLLFFIFSVKISAQNVDYEKMSLDEIEESFANINDNENGEKVSKIYIKRAKKEKNIEALFRAYRLACFYTIKPKNLRYVDSTIITAKRINEPSYLANAYICSNSIKNINN